MRLPSYELHNRMADPAARHPLAELKGIFAELFTPIPH